MENESPKILILRKNLRVDPHARFQHLMTILKQQGYRAMPQRVAFLKIISTSEEHPSATRIYERMREQFPTTTLATVYKTLAFLKEMGEVLELEFSGAENRYDGNNPSLHLHLLRVQRRIIVDPQVDLLSRLPTQVEKKTGFQITGQRVDLYARCPDCQSKARALTSRSHRTMK